MSFLLWQLIDSAFPSGGFAHSAGLEASLHHGHVPDGAGVHAFAKQALAQCGRGALPLVTGAHRAPDDLPTLDELCDVFLSNPIANRASRAQGRALLTSVARAFPDVDISTVTRGESQPAGHYAPLFGALFNLLQVNLIDTQRAFLFIAARGVSSAAVRLGLIGAYDAQTIQAGLAQHIDFVIHE